MSSGDTAFRTCTSCNCLHSLLITISSAFCSSTPSGFLVLVHRPTFWRPLQYKDLSETGRSNLNLRVQRGRCLSFPHARTQTDSVPETSVMFFTTSEVGHSQNPCNRECRTRSSETFGTYFNPPLFFTSRIRVSQQIKTRGELSRVYFNLWSEFLASYPEGLGLIPGATSFSEK
jgi:hypothetical protein